jgi:ribosomal protein S18 acetylase RimI-like enzyme
LSQTLGKFGSNGVILAEIKKDNIPSVRLFEKNSFKIYKEDKDNYYLKFNPAA